MTECDEIVVVMDIVLTKKTNTITANVTTTASINCYILHAGFSVIILLLISIIISYYNVKQKGIIQNGKQWIQKS